MVCGGFSCSKNALCALNVVYLLVSLLLIGIAGWGKGYGIVSSISVIGGIIGVGVFLFFIALVGFIGAAKHHQVLLFFYMVVLFLLFIIQLCISFYCLGMNKESQETMLHYAWERMDNDTKADVQNNLKCCGFFQKETNDCPKVCSTHQCSDCGNQMLQHAAEVLHVCGGVGLFFSFTEILGVWLAARFRNQKDPRANPSAFL
uniref:tetraspanin-31-like n=1 Tax=Myxine glutinosa TaxID=7769 RepID=UPI00358E77C8